ncbi:hypothetical protein [Bacillus toyonensis]|uniref:Uncharacterized protein n=1 Tax=Bacillus toyonensis TaxID=155322 RepID=A0A2B7WDY5_9BACI|nr:hypothetical protein [Bacillus toyonensis]PEA32427.1 hypothetical protein COO13_14940 [Bacillus toyonensis]PEJ84399.1 hypothetical protein CN891_23990 [Bacillus toyonensis]PEJ85716.1 hypothetical protein CN688_29755 [Bacillus toyonensis]PEJ94223.1 hypothetical protein CN687_15415 [Bacillus toyonensis]PEK08502.1 hypothetical protein CN683_29815 [Bacillus toyonensis]
MQALLFFAVVLLEESPIIIKLTNRVAPKTFIVDEEDLGNGKLKNKISKDLYEQIYHSGLQIFESKI